MSLQLRLQPIMSDEDPTLNADQRIWQVLAAIPPGRVASYGQIAALAGLGRGARQVGRTLRLLPGDSRLPWHRVINAQGKIALPPGSRGYSIQTERLRDEGVIVSDSGKINLRQFRWQP